MLVMILFAAILTVLKTHLLAHTSNRIDVALGARLFRHVLHIPLRSLGAAPGRGHGRVVRELEHIRLFIAGSIRLRGQGSKKLQQIRSLIFRKHQGISLR